MYIYLVVFYCLYLKVIVVDTPHIYYNGKAFDSACRDLRQC